MVKQIFIGGHFSSGTRVVQFLLRQFYNIGRRVKDEFGDQDYEIGFSKRPTWGERVLLGERPEFPIQDELKEPFALKNPEFMFCVPHLKRLFPESKFILVVRNGFDQILCDNRCMSVKLGQYFDLKEVDYFKREMEFWNKTYKKVIENGQIDLIIKLEDLVNNTLVSVKKIMKLVGIKKPVDISMIKKPESMGRYNNDWVVKLGQDVLKEERIEEYLYKPEMKKELSKIGAEMLNYFQYD